MLFFLLASTAIAQYTTAAGGYYAKHVECRALKNLICNGTCALIDQAVASQVLNFAGAPMIPAGMTTSGDPSGQTAPLFAMFGFMMTFNITTVPAIWPDLNAVYECDNDLAKGDAQGWNQFSSVWNAAGNCFSDGVDANGVPQGCYAAMATIQTKAEAKGVPYTAWPQMGGAQLPQLVPQLTTPQACDLFFSAMDVENAKSIALLANIVALVFSSSTGALIGDSVITACNKQLKDEINKAVFKILMIVGAVALVVGALLASVGCCYWNKSKKSGVASAV